MLHLTFEPHATTLDNEAKRASGWNDVTLSPLGETQARELGVRRAGEHFDAIFCSDLERSYKTAELAFGDKFPTIQDERLRECNYGEWTLRPSSEVEAEKPNRISTPFPGGESYEQAAERMRQFLSELLRDYDDKRVLIIGHRATQYSLEHWINKVPLAIIVPAPWKWQPGWEYDLASLDTLS